MTEQLYQKMWAYLAHKYDFECGAWEKFVKGLKHHRNRAPAQAARNKV